MSRSRDLQERLAFLGLDDEALTELAVLGDPLEARADELVEAFYRHLLGFPRTRQLLRDDAVRRRLLEMQREYLISLIAPQIDDAYVAHRRHIGDTHERVGLEPRWYLGAYALYLSLLTPMLLEALADAPDRAARVMTTLQRLLMLDAQLAIETYIERRERELERLNRELAQASSRLQEEFSAQQRQLGRTAKRARAAEELASIGTLVAGLAHEIGTPMGVIQGHAKLLEKAVKGEQAKWRLTTIQEQIGRISRIIQSLLNMARPKTGALSPVALEPLIDSTLAFLTDKFSRRGVEVIRQFEPVASIEGDPERLQQLLLNLLMNATDAMPDGGELLVGLSTEPDGQILLRVEDDGTGVPPDQLSRLFDPFFTTKDAGKGNGLGLTVARGIVGDHGGRIEVESEPGTGTRFRILLPAA